jgi:transposase-like protein
MPKLLLCPHCGHGRSWFLRRTHRRCKRCRKEWSPGTAHLVRGFRLGRREWFRIVDTFLRDETICSVQEECAVAYATAQRAVDVLRQVMTLDVPLLFVGVCEADETYVGGSWKNKAIHIRRQGTKRGRGTSKQPIFGVMERGDGTPSQVRVWLTKDTKNCSLNPHIKEVVCRGSLICTDGRKGYRRLPRYGYLHQWVDHDAGEYVRGNVHTQTLDGFWGLLKTHLDSIGGIRKGRLHLFVGEYAWRYNFRNLTRKEQTKRLVKLLTEFGGRS